MKPVRVKDLAHGEVPYSVSQIWKMVADGEFPQPFKLSANTTVFDLDEVHDWLEAKKKAARDKGVKASKYVEAA